MMRRPTNEVKPPGSRAIVLTQTDAYGDCLGLTSNSDKLIIITTTTTITAFSHSSSLNSNFVNTVTDSREEMETDRSIQTD